MTLKFLKCLWYNQRLVIYPHGFAFLMNEFEREVKIPNIPHEDVELVTPDRVKLRCYLIPHSSSKSLRGTVILFHGNAMNHGDLVDPHAVLFSKRGFTVLTVEYRGYGLSDGVPSESGLQLDAQAGFEFIAGHPELSKHPIIIYGQSLGGAVAIDVTSRNADKISALIIENTFSSVPHLVREWPMGRFLSFFVTQKWYSASKLADLPPSLPVLMLSGLRDSVIPPSEMIELRDVAKRRKGKKRKKWEWFGFAKEQANEQEQYLQPDRDVFESFDRGDHNNTYLQPGYWDTITAFLNAVVPSKANSSSRRFQRH